MKIVCSKNELTKGINIVSKAVPTRSTMSILECILIDATTDSIKLTANDMNLAIETIIEGTIEERGAIAIDYRMLSEYVGSFTGDMVTIESGDENKVNIYCEKSKFNNVEIKPASDFSAVPTVTRNEPIVISQLTLREVINKTIFSIGDDKGNKLMTGVLFEIEEDNLKVVSLDGFRISIRNIGLKNSYSSKKVVIPGKTLKEIVKIIGGGSEDMVNIYTTDNHIIFEYDNTTVVSRLIEGEYFKIDQMIPQYYETELIVNKKELLDTVNSASLLSREGDIRPINFNITDDNINISINSNRSGYTGDVSTQKTGADLKIAFKPKFMIDALKVIDEDEIGMYMIDKKSPCVIKDEEGSYIYMLLPVNTAN